jgi:hypothetical protein
MPNIVIPKYKLLYHFTAAHCINPIKRQGIWKGMLPWQRDPQGNACVIRAKDETRMTAAELRRLNEIEAERAARGKLYFRPGFQWLTSNPEWAQSWCVLGSLPFPKNAYRIKILIPETGIHRLTKWSEMCARGRPDCAEEINSKAVDWHNWWVFYGPIPYNWVTEPPARNFQQQITAELDGKGGP